MTSYLCENALDFIVITWIMGIAVVIGMGETLYYTTKENEYLKEKISNLKAEKLII